MSFAVYPSYKNSGVAWLGDVPNHWSVQRLGGLFTERREKVSDLQFPPLSVTKQGIVPQLETAAKSDDNDNRKCVRSGDFVINSRSDRKGSSGLSLLEGSVSLINTVITPGEDLDPSFIHYLLRSEPFQEEYYRYGKGIVADLWSTNYSEMKNIVLAFPGRLEQSTIAAFLDGETAKIDELVEEQRRLIALLKEKRLSIISQAVTRGLNPAAPTKLSGVEWLGDVPAHWEVKSLKQLSAVGTSITYGIVQAGPHVPDGVPYIRTSDMSGDHLPEEGYLRTSMEIDRAYSRSRVRAGDLVIAIRATVGKPLIVPPVLEGANLTQGTAKFSPSEKISSRFAQLVLASAGASSEFERIAKGATFKEITLDMLRKFRIPVPSRHEQEAICSMVDAVEKQFDELQQTAALFEQILRERRTALISGAVTGKIDVRGSADVRPFARSVSHARALVATEIIERSAHQATFGRVKLQKIAYLAEAHAGVSELEGAYSREAAGPLDRNLISDLESGAAVLAGIQVDQPGGAGTAVTYKLSRLRGAHRQELTGFLGADRTAKLDSLIQDVSALDTKGVEAVATLYAVWNDALIEGEKLTDDEIVAAFLSEWHPEKAKKFRAYELHEWLGWMRRHDLVPTGSGPKTSTGRLFG